MEDVVGFGHGRCQMENFVISVSVVPSVIAAFHAEGPVAAFEDAGRCFAALVDISLHFAGVTALSRA